MPQHHLPQTQMHLSPNYHPPSLHGHGHHHSVSVTGSTSGGLDFPVFLTCLSAARGMPRKQEATFVCPIPGCGSTFTRRFDLKGWFEFLCFRFSPLLFLVSLPLPLPSHPCSFPWLCDCKKLTFLNTTGHIRSHNGEKPFQCHWPGCGKGFARQHDCKRHEQLHSTNPVPYIGRLGSFGHPE